MLVRPMNGIVNETNLGLPQQEQGSLYATEIPKYLDTMT